MRRPVAYVARIVPAYRVPILEQLNERLGGRLLVCSGTPPNPTLEDSAARAGVSFRHIKLTNHWIGDERAVLQRYRAVFAVRPGVVLAEESPRTLTLPPLLWRARRKGIATLLWGHFSSNHRVFSKASVRDRYRVALARMVDGCVCYTDAVADLLRAHIPEEKLFVARNTLDTETLFALQAALAAEGRVAVRKRLGIPPEASVMAFIGRLIASKRPAELLEVYRAVRARGPAALVMIGSGPELPELRRRVSAAGWTHVRFLGSMQDMRESAPWLYASDVLVCPGYVGLNVNHAFCLGLPVVTQAAPGSGIRYHSPEIEYLRPGSNGLLAPHGSTEGLVRATLNVLQDRQRFSAHALEFARSHLSVQTMLDGLDAAIRHAEHSTLSE